MKSLAKPFEVRTARGVEADVQTLVPVVGVSLHVAARVDHVVVDAAVTIHQAASEVDEMCIRHLDIGEDEALPWHQADGEQPPVEVDAAYRHMPSRRSVRADASGSRDTALERLQQVRLR